MQVDLIKFLFAEENYESKDRIHCTCTMLSCTVLAFKKFNKDE